MAVKDLTYPPIPKTLEELDHELKVTRFMLEANEREMPEHPYVGRKHDAFMLPEMRRLLAQQRHWISLLTTARACLVAEAAPEQAIAQAA